MARKPAAATRQSEDDVLAAAMERVQREQGGDDGESGVGDEVVEEAAPATAVKKKAGETKVAGKTTVTNESVPRSKAKTSKIAYTPLDREDPSFTIFFGMKFEANVERDVANPECIRLATQNPWFKVDGKHHATRKAPPKREEDDLSARSGLPDGADPDKVEVEATATDFV